MTPHPQEWLDWECDVCRADEELGLSCDAGGTYGGTPLWKKLQTNAIPSTPKYSSESNKSTGPHRNLYGSVSSSLIYPSRKLEPLQVPTHLSEWMNEPHAVHSYNRILLRDKWKQMIHAIAWMDLKIIMQGELSQFEKKALKKSRKYKL